MFRHGAAVVVVLAAGWAAAGPPVKLVEVRKIWDQAPHNAFTDLVRYKDRWLCSFREGAGHASGEGKLRIIASAEGRTWEPQGLVEVAGQDLRDPKLSVTPAGRLMLTSAAAVPASRDPVRDHYSFVCFSEDGRTWTKPRPVLASWQWLWRVTWHGDTAYGVAYEWDPPGKSEARGTRAFLAKSTDGTAFTKVADFAAPGATEGSLAFEGETMVCLLRRDGQPNTAWVGRSEPPYREWQWKDLGVYLGGPHLVRVGKGEWLAAGRLIEKGQARTVVGRLDVTGGQLTPLVTLPSGGDTSYPGLVRHGEEVWMSYYSSHEGKSAIYLARLRLGR